MPDGTGHIMTAVQVNGHPLKLVVDTGSDHSMITPHTVEALGLTKEALPNSINGLWGGHKMDKLTHVDVLQIGRLTFDHSTLFVMPVEMRSGADGLLGTDFLARFDLDFDFAHGKLNLIDPNHCPGDVIYWADEANAARIPFRKQARDVPVAGINTSKLVVPVSIDGKEELAILDTGSPITTLDLDTAKQDFAIADGIAGLTKLRQPEGSYRYTFQKMSFGEKGAVNVSSPVIRLDPYSVHQMPPGWPKILVGMDVLARLHLYISYRERMLFVTEATAHKAAP